MNWEAVVSTIALALVAIACLAHLKAMGRAAHLCERIGFSVTFGGALCSAAEWWWPALDAYHGDLAFVIGCGLIAVSVIAKVARAKIDIALGNWNGIERRRCHGDPFVAQRFGREQ